MVKPLANRSTLGSRLALRAALGTRFISGGCLLDRAGNGAQATLDPAVLGGRGAGRARIQSTEEPQPGLG